MDAPLSAALYPLLIINHFVSFIHVSFLHRFNRISSMQHQIEFISKYLFLFSLFSLLLLLLLLYLHHYDIKLYNDQNVLLVLYCESPVT